MKLRKPHRLRVLLLGLGFAAFTGAIGWRLYDLQHLRHERFAARSQSLHYRHVVIQPERGDILDRNGRTLAQSTGRTTVYINPAYFRDDSFRGDRGELARLIAAETNADPADILTRLRSANVTRIARRVPPEVGNRVVHALAAHGADSRGYWVHRESIRLYPTRSAGPVIGFCTTDEDGDNIGIAGLELEYNDLLSGRKIVSRSQRSGLRETLQAWEPDDLHDARGHTLRLTLDAGLQETVEKIMADTVEKFNAAAGGAVVLDSNTGAVLAMGSYPTFDNNAFSVATAEQRRPRLITDPFETGSVAKLFTGALLVDLGIEIGRAHV